MQAKLYKYTQIHIMYKQTPTDRLYWLKKEKVEIIRGIHYINRYGVELKLGFGGMVEGL